MLEFDYQDFSVIYNCTYIERTPVSQVLRPIDAQNVPHAPACPSRTAHVRCFDSLTVATFSDFPRFALLRIHSTAHLLFLSETRAVCERAECAPRGRAEPEWWLTLASSTQQMVNIPVGIYFALYTYDVNNVFNNVVEATAYISAVAAFAAVVLVLLLFLGRRWCHSTVFNRKCCDDILAVNPRNPTPCLPIENAQIGKTIIFLLKRNSY